MKKRVTLYYMLLIIISLLCINMSTGCSRRAAKPAPEKEDTKKKPPDTLKDLEEGIDKIMKQLDKDQDEEEKNQVQVKIESETEVKRESDPQKAENESKQETKQEVKRETAEDKAWKSVNDSIENIHKQWNSLQPQIVQGGVAKNTIDDFSNTLNNLTMFADAEDKPNTLLAASELYRFVPDFMQPYDNKIPPDVKRIGYLLRSTKYNAMIGKWDIAKANLEKLKSHWSLTKALLKKEQENPASKMEFAIYELENVVNQNNIMLTEIKSDIAMDDLRKLEESFEK